MSGFIPKRLPTSRRTHFLCYPLYSPRSSLQLQNLVKKLRDDELTLHCPQKAFRMPKSFHLRIAEFSLINQRTVEAASEFMRNLDINRMLRNAETEANSSNQNETATKATIREDGYEVPVPPLSVSLVGLSEFLSSKEDMHKAHAITVDPTNRLPFLSTEIIQRFAAAGIEKIFRTERMSFNAINAWKARYRQRMKDDVTATTFMKSWAPYDTRDLIKKYKDVVLSESIPLEKLSLCKFGRIRTFKGDGNEVLVDEYYEEVESIPLPQ